MFPCSGGRNAETNVESLSGVSHQKPVHKRPLLLEQAFSFQVMIPWHLTTGTCFGRTIALRAGALIIQGCINFSTVDVKVFDILQPKQFFKKNLMTFEKHLNCF